MSSVPRAATDGESFLGLRPRIVVEPATVAEAAEAMRALAADRQAILFRGGGTELELGTAPARLDALFSTTRLTRVIEHAPADQIVAVEGGLTLAALQRHLAEHGQRLAIDPPLAEQATVGGIVAASSFGPRRTRYGAIRDLVIGITVVRADGVIARGGGKVVKNVAGFDLPRLFCGSLGTLGLVAEVVLRLHPLPETSATVLIGPLVAGEARAFARRTLDARLEPTAVAALSEGEGFRLALRFEGFAPGVREQLARLRSEVLVDRELVPLTGAEEAELWAGHDRLRTRGDLRAKAAFAPASFEKAVPALETLCAALDGAAIVAYPTLGLAFVSGTLAATGAAALAVESARAALASHGGSLVLAAAPMALRERVDVWGPAPGIEVMRRLKHELDPGACLAPGRFAGGI